MRIRFSWRHYMNVFMHPLLGASPMAMFNTLVRLRTLPTLHFLPKYIFVSAVSILNLPFILIEWVYLRFATSETPTNPVFIIGHPRTGTTHLQQVLAEDPQFYTPELSDVLFPNFSNTFARVLTRIMSPFLPETRPQDNVALKLNSPQEEEFAIAATSGDSFINGFYYPRQFKKIIDRTVLFREKGDKERWQKSLLRFVKGIQPRSRGRRLILKSPANMARINAILEIFPDAKFICIERDPQRTLQSTLHLFEKVVPQTSFQYIRPDEMVNNALYMYEVFHKAYRKQSEYLDSKNLLTITHEDFLHNPLAELGRIFGFLGIESTMDSNTLQNYMNYRKNTHKPLPESLMFHLQDIETRVGKVVTLDPNRKENQPTEKVA